MATKNNQKLIDLKNIGARLSGRLNEVGIFSERELASYGAVNAFKMIQEKYPDENLAVCYYLYLFEGALCDEHWDKIGEKRKQE